MWLTSLLPVALALPAFSAPSTPNDPFHKLALQAPKSDDGPVCCLRPLSPPESPEEGVLLSFEEWKQRQLASILKEQHHIPSTHPPASSQTHVGVPADNASSEPVIPTPPLGDNQNAQPVETVEAPVPDAPYFRIPITDRFNYASTDCSARVHTAHKSAKSPSAILSSKKDRYMLSPCNEKEQFVVVELCDDIRIDTVQLANHEFFSGVFKDFTVSVAKTYTGEWVTAGTYRAKNTRSLQSFHPPTTLGDFYRFIRIDFHSHYGNEYYCPLSLLRVYGLTHLEHWKWDLWESESKAKRALEESVAFAEQVPELPRPAERVDPSTQEAAEQPVTSCNTCGSPPVGHAPTSSSSGDSGHHDEAGSSATAHSSQSTDVQPGDTSSSGAEPSGTQLSVTSATQTTAPAAISHNTEEGPSVSLASSSYQQPPKFDTSNDSERQHITDSLYTTHALSSSSSTVPASHSVSLSLSAPASPVSAQGSSSPPSSSSHSHSSHSSSSSAVQSVSVHQPAHSNRSSSSTTSSTTLSQSLVVVTPTLSASSGESIYRTIMNRLTALETNTSLYARFVEEHTASVREMLRKLSEEVGRLEGLGKAQAQTYQRTVSQFERQQRRIELEHDELLKRVSRLTDEVVLEKRLGILQLCLLLAVLVFMALTRGSRNEPVRTSDSEGGSTRSRTSSLRGWGHRTLSISGDWMNRFRSRSASPPANRQASVLPPEHERPQELTIRTDSSQSIQAGEAYPRYKRAHPSPGGRKLGIIVRPRTPTAIATSRSHTARLNSPLHFPTTPTRASQMTAPLHRTGPRDRPPIQRSHSSTINQSFSMGMIDPKPKSARHWARTAHLHEVKNINVGSRSRAVSVNGGHGEREGASDVFSAGTAGVDAHSLRENGERGRRNGKGMDGSDGGEVVDVSVADVQINGTSPPGDSSEALQQVEVDGSEDVWVDTDVDNDSGVESLHDEDVDCRD